MKIGGKNISIRIKIIITVLISTILFAVLIYHISSIIVLKGYAELEKQEMIKGTERTDTVFKNAVSELDIKLSDWAAWDNSYIFVQDGNQEYIDINLQDPVFFQLGINLMLFMNNDGKIIYGKTMDLNTEESISSEDELMSYIKNNIKLFKFTDLEGSFSGIISLEEGNFLIVARPVIKSDETGPIPGSMILGKFINNDFLKNIEKLTQLSIKSYPYNFSTFTADLSLAKTNLSKTKKYFVNPLTNDSIAGYYLLYDINNNPVSILKVVGDRDMYKQGKNSFNFFVLVISISVLFFGAIILFFFEIAVVSRIHNLNRQIFDIAESDDISKRIKIDRDDEIGDLIMSINNMLDDLYVTQERERNANAQERIATEKLKVQMEEVSKLNKMMTGRELKMIELKEKIDELKSKLENKA